MSTNVTEETSPSGQPGWAIVESPVGPLTAIAGPGGIRKLHFSDESPRLAAAARRPMPEAVSQLDAYFAGDRQAFDLDLDLRGTPLQKLVWALLLEIPYGETTTYGELARRIDDDAYPEGLEPYKRARLVGAEIGRNPVAIVVPCHRVIGADGSLTGYRGGLERKRTLLELEGSLPGRAPESSPASLQLGLL
jgi:methylated-DNA-[protein]-cysteine S-methyltransferase